MSNGFKTAVLLGFLGALFMVIGLALGGSSGLVIGFAIGLLFCGGTYWFSDKLAIASARAKPVTQEENPLLYAIVGDLAQRAQIPMPRIYVSPEQQPNAFATGRNPNHAVVCVTQGILDALPPDELKGVLAHELSHVKHRDILIGSVAAAFAMAIMLIVRFAFWASLFGGRDNEGPWARSVALRRCSSRRSRLV
jgi:heat shock protein HtpX